MQTPSVAKIILMLVSLLLGAGALVLRARIPLPAAEQPEFKPAKKKRNLLMLAGVLALWFFLGLFLGLFGSGNGAFEVTISPARMNLFGFSVSSSVVLAWVVIAILTLFAVVIRLFVIPRFQEKPRGFQLILETAVETISNFTKEKFGHENDNLSAYFFALAALFVGSAIVELFGFRPPTTDLTMTLSYALVTFILINYFGIRKKGVKGRLKTLTKPVAVVAPFKRLICRFFQHIAVTGGVKGLFTFIRIKRRGLIAVTAPVAAVVLLSTRGPGLLRTLVLSALVLPS